MAALELGRRAALQLGEASAQEVLGQRSPRRLPLRMLVPGPRLPRPGTPVASWVRTEPLRRRGPPRVRRAQALMEFITAFRAREKSMGTAERGARLEPASQQGTVEGAGLLVLRSPPRPLLCPQGRRGRARVYSAAWPVSPAGPSARHGPCGRQGPEHLKPRRPRARKLLAALPARTCSAGWPHARSTSTAATATSQGGSPTRRGHTVAPRCCASSCSVRAATVETARS